MASKNRPIFMLVDAHALIHKGYHAIPHLSTSSGELTNGIYGFTSILLAAIKELNPDCIAVAFDLPKPTFRHLEYEDYKAHRKPSPRELTLQIPKVHTLVEAFNIPIYEQEGYEADDLIGTLSTKIAKEHPEMEVIIVTGDRDMFQLVSDNVKVYYAGGPGLKQKDLWGPKEVEKKYGFDHKLFVDYKALLGDASDNIPGVPGVGDKTATDLIQKFGSLEEILAAAKQNDQKIKPAVLKKLQENEKQAELSKKLSAIITDIDINVDLDACRLRSYDYKKVVELFKELEFKSLLPKIPRPDDVPAEVNRANSLDKLTQKFNYTLIDSEKTAKELVKKLEQAEELAVDTETDNLNSLEANVIGVSFSIEDGEAYYVDVVKEPGLLKILKPILENESIKKIGHNLKYDFQALENHGIKLAPLYFDTMIAAYLLNPGSRNHNLDTTVFNEFGHEMMSYESLVGKGKQAKLITEIDANEVCKYACEDADFTLRLFKVLKQRLYEEKTLHLLEEIEMPLVSVLAQMERYGVALDTKFLADLSKKLHIEIEKLEQEIYKLSGTEFNVNSPSQLAGVLFENLKIESKDIKKTKTGISTAASELEKMRDRHPVVQKILEYRELAKLASTYVDPLPAMLSSTDNRLHTSYNQTIAATGRLSSTDPNLQNIPIKTEMGNQIRKAFIAEEGFELLAIDYSQIELRIAATLAKDETMLEIFKSGHDFHAGTASKIFEVPIEKVTPKQRRDAKTINFSVLYGVSAFGLSSRSDMTRAEAKIFIDKYFETFPKIKKYIDDTIEFTREKGFAENPLGRKRYFPEIISSNFQVRAAAERAAFNMPLQSLAADIIKLAMIKLHSTFPPPGASIPPLSKGGLRGVEGGDIRMLLQVHDELVFEVKTGEQDNYAKKIKEIMESVYNLEAGLIADAKVGKNWGEMKGV